MKKNTKNQAVKVHRTAIIIEASSKLISKNILHKKHKRVPQFFRIRKICGKNFARSHPSFI